MQLIDDSNYLYKNTSVRQPNRIDRASATAV